jgi:hypothetical protein
MAKPTTREGRRQREGTAAGQQAGTHVDNTALKRFRKNFKAPVGSHRCQPAIGEHFLCGGPEGDHSCIDHHGWCTDNEGNLYPHVVNHWDVCFEQVEDD